MNTMSSFRDFCLWFCMVWTAFESFIKSSHTLAYLLLNLCPTSRIFFCQARGNFKKKPSRVMTVMHHAFLNVNSFVCNVDERCQVFFSIYDAREGRFIRCVRISLVLLLFKQNREIRKPRWRRLRKRLLRWCYTGRFATTIFSTTECYNVGTMLQPLETMSQQCFATLCCAKNCRCESSRATSS